MTVALETFIPDIAVECSGASNPLILLGGAHGCHRVLSQEPVPREEADPVTLTEGCGVRTIRPNRRQIVQIMSVNLDGDGTFAAPDP